MASTGHRSWSSVNLLGVDLDNYQEYSLSRVASTSHRSWDYDRVARSSHRSWSSVNHVAIDLDNYQIVDYPAWQASATVVEILTVWHVAATVIDVPSQTM